MKHPDKTVSTRKRPKREVHRLPQKQDLERLPELMEPEPEPRQPPEKHVYINVSLQLTGNIQRCIWTTGVVIAMLLGVLGFHGG